MSHTKHSARNLAALGALAAALAFPRLAGTETVDDTFLLSTSVSPNVILILDNSYAMNQIEWHEDYDPTSGLITCNFYDNTTNYVYSGGNSSETHCGQTRTIYKPGNPTLWNGRYLNWYFSLNPLLPAHAQILDEIENNIFPAASCNQQAGSGTRFVNQYRRTRADAARQVFFDVLCLSEPKGLRFGLGIFRDAAEAGTPKVDPNGGYLAAAVDDNTPTHAADLEAHIGNTRIDDGGTPLSEAVFQFYTYLMPRANNATCIANGSTCPPLGNDNATQFPAYIYNKNGADSSASGGPLPDPVQFSCQKNYIILVTGGLASRDDFDRDPISTSVGFDNFNALIGDYYAEGDTEVPGTADERTLYLDDITKYMHEKDHRPDFDDDQTIDFYTIGFMTTAAENAYLERVSEGVGGGLHFSVEDGAGLSQALVDALNDIVEKARSFTAATVPSSRTADGGDFYNSFFLPSDKIAFWEGHLRAWKFSAAGEILDSGDNCALADPDGGSECNSGPFRVRCAAGQTWPACANPYWDAGEVLSQDFVPGSSNVSGARTLYTSKLAGSPTAPQRTDFALSTLNAADMKIATFDLLATPPSPNSALYPTKGSTATSAEGLADEVIAYARGCAFGTGVSSNVSVPTACEERPWMLGDIFHSDPIAVRQPPDRPLGTAYTSFRSAYIDRDRVIYTGTNGGFLEAFHAGTWDVPTTGAYGQGTGSEKFGFMPWEPRTRIKSLPIDSPTNRKHYVDGAPQVSDAWLYTTSTVVAQTASEWRTMIVGGLREGGRHYYALDITNPSNDTTPWSGTPIEYPKLQWEFPNENDFNSGSGDYTYMGQTWGQPVITRVKLQIGCPGASCATNLERWVAIVSGGYDEASDPNPSTVDPAKAAYAAATNKGRAIYMIDLKTGKVIARQRMGFDADGAGGAAAPSLNHSLVSTPAVLDVDADGYADVVYIGDLAGNLWKWVIHAIGEDRVNDSSSVFTQPNWEFYKIFSALTVTISGDTYYKNIYQPPAAAFVGNKLYIAFGTGERAAIAYQGVTDSTCPTPPCSDNTWKENNRYYVLTDADPLATTSTPASPPTVRTEADLTFLATPTTNVTSPYGYYFRAADGEKFVTTSVIFAGKVIAASFTPSQLGPGDPGYDPCSSRGNGNLYRFDLATGRGSYEDALGNESRFKSIGSGLPTDPKISIGVGGKDNKVVTQMSGTEVNIEEEVDVDFGRGIIYWRELK